MRERCRATVDALLAQFWVQVLYSRWSSINNKQLLQVDFFGEAPQEPAV